MGTGRSRASILWWYGRSYLMVGALVSAFVAAQLYRYGAGPLRPLIYFKLATTVVFGCFVYRRQLRHRAFYHNLQYATADLLGPAVMADALGCIVLSIVAYAAR